MSAFFETSDDIFDSVLTLVYLLLLALFPIFIFVKLRTGFRQQILKDNKFSSVYGLLYSDLRLTNIHRVNYNAYFVARRMAMALTLVQLEQFPFFQCTIMTVLSTMNFIYLFCTRPFDSPSESRIEIFNEGTIVLCSHLMTIFLNIAIAEDSLWKLGWVLIGIMSVNIAANIAIVGFRTLYLLYKEFQKRKILRNKANQKQQQTQERLWKIAINPSKFRVL